MKRAFQAYCLTLLAVVAIYFLRAFGWPADGDLFVGAYGVVLSAVALGILAAVPALASWLVFWLLLQLLRLSPRISAVLSAGPSACVTVYAVGFVVREFSSGFGGPPPPWPDGLDVAAVAILAMTAAFAIWTVSPERAVTG